MVKPLVVALSVPALTLAVMSFAQTPSATRGETAVVAVPSKLQWAPCPDALPAGCELAVVHGNPSEGAADTFVRIPKAYAFPAHSHSSAEHIVVVRGRLEGNVEGSGHFSVGPGSYLFAPGNTVHTARCAGKTSCVLYIGWDRAIDVNVVK